MGSRSSSLLLNLAREIQINARILSDTLATSNLPQPSFEADGPTVVVPLGAPQAAVNAQSLIADHAFKLFQLVTGPSELLPNITATYQTIFSVRWLVHFGILAHIPLQGSAPYATVAAEAKVPESQLKSIARLAMTSGILQEPEPNKLSHTASSVMFIKNENMLNWARFMFAASMPTAATLVEATEKWPESLSKNETAYNLAFQSELPFFDYLSQNPDLNAKFSGYMKNVTGGPGTALSHLIDGFDWAGLPQNAQIVDIGGSTGHGTLALAEAFPNLRFEIQDLEPVTKKASELLKTKRDQIVSRVSVRAHDFFQPQPVKGADVYLLRMIIHDWSEIEAKKILSNIVSSMGENSIILLMDTVLPAPGQVLATKERILRSRDLTMIQIFNAKERSLDDWKELIRETDRRLELRSVRQPVGSYMSLLAIGLDH